MMRIRTIPAALLAGCLTSCTLTSCTREIVEFPPHVNISPEEVELAGSGATAGEAPAAHLGLTVEANESDSLERLEVLPGARVRSVERGGPAALAGLQSGDVVLGANGMALADRDGFRAIAGKVKPGELLTLEVRRGTVVSEMRVIAGGIEEKTIPRELYRADPLKSRAGYRTVLVGRGDEKRVAAELVKVFPRSPLPGCGLVVGDRITRLEGRPLTSAQDLVRRLLEEHAFGDDVEITILSGSGEETLEVSLWAPRRRISGLRIPLLFTYESSLKPDRTSWDILDLFIFSLFGYRRDGGEREYRILSLFRFRTGYGELVEEPARGGQ